MIDTREELLIALTDAAEVEHNLACLYLFAAFSLKERVEEGVTSEQLATIDGWKQDLLRIAMQEMSHLGTVCNLQTAVGGVGHVWRPNFPCPLLRYPPNIPFTLERFSLESVKRFIDFEKPEPPPDPHELIAPKPLEYTRVGPLYRTIYKGIEKIDQQTLFFRGQNVPQDEALAGGHVEPRAVRTQQEALAAVIWIIEEGEGTPTGGSDSHFAAFTRIKTELEAMQTATPGFEPARNVANNPMTRQHRVTGSGTIIKDTNTRDAAELFNALYITMLYTLGQYYAFAGETSDQRKALKKVLIQMMKRVIRPLGEALTLLPMGDSAPGQFAGAGFEIYGYAPLSTDVKSCWTILLERLAEEEKETNRLKPVFPAEAGIGAVATAVGQIRGTLTTALG